jgi:hypothetical protein
MKHPRQQESVGAFLAIHQMALEVFALPEPKPVA